MKKVLLIVLLAAGFQQLKAQQTLKPLPDMKLSDGLSGNFFKPKSDDLFNRYLKPKPAGSTARFLALFNDDKIIIYSKMPVAKLDYSNIDNMPIYSPAASGVHY